MQRRTYAVNGEVIGTCTSIGYEDGLEKAVILGNFEPVVGVNIPSCYALYINPDTDDYSARCGLGERADREIEKGNLKDIRKVTKELRDEPAKRFDSGKPRFELIPSDALGELAMVYTKGAEKYAEHNWCKGMSWSRCLGSLLRHTFAWAVGEDLDKETGLHHMAHAAWNCLTLVAYAKRTVGNDDRLKL